MESVGLEELCQLFRDCAVSLSTDGVRGSGGAVSAVSEGVRVPPQRGHVRSGQPQGAGESGRSAATIARQPPSGRRCGSLYSLFSGDVSPCHSLADSERWSLTQHILQKVSFFTSGNDVQIFADI